PPLQSDLPEHRLRDGLAHAGDLVIESIKRQQRLAPIRRRKQRGLVAVAIVPSHQAHERGFVVRETGTRAGGLRFTKEKISHSPVLACHLAMTVRGSIMAFELPPLSFPKNALEPYTSAKTLEFHHGKHHQTYVKTLNELIEGTPLERQSLEQIIKATYKDQSKTK